jgi:hypothetical protein
MERPAQSKREWGDARRRAFIRDALGVLSRRPVDLLPFAEVQQRLHLRTSHFLGIQHVPLDQIVGSTDRYADFTREFLPRFGFLEQRWERVDMLVHRPEGLGPVELYQVGEAYFVRDGNHRVSVARQHGDSTIAARVWRFDVRVPLDAGTSLEDLLCQEARIAFLEATEVDRLCPDADIVLNQPDGYEPLLHEIWGFRQALSRIDKRDVPPAEAVRLWCDMAYLPVVQIIRQQDILREFPGCTETDLYVWLRNNRDELEIRYGRDVLMAEAADDLVARFGHRPSRARRLREGAGRAAAGVGELAGRLTAQAPRTAARADGVRARVRAAQLLEAAYGPTADAPRLRLSGDRLADWAQWHARLSEQVWDALALGDRPWLPSDSSSLDEEVDETVLVDDLKRELIWLGSDDGLRVPVHLYTPLDGHGSDPAIVVLPGHGTLADVAATESAGALPNALTLARAGFVVLAVEPRGFGLLGSADHLQVDRAARTAGRTWQGLLVSDALRAIDYLAVRAEITPGAVGALGVGAGGGIAMLAAALDGRVEAVVSIGHLSAYRIACSDPGTCACGDLPGILPHAEMGDVAGLIAPRPALYVRDPGGPRSTLRCARESYAIAQRVYRALEVPNRVKLVESASVGDAFDHELAVMWFSRWLSV